MAALRVGILRAEAIVGVADQGGRRRGCHESFAGERVDPVGGASAGGKIVSDGLWIGGVFSHLAKERRGGRATGGRGLYRQQTFSFSLLISELSTEPLPKRVSNEVLLFSPLSSPDSVLTTHSQSSLSPLLTC